MVTQQMWSIWCKFLCLKVPTTCRRQANCQVDETYYMMTSLNAVKHNLLLCIGTPSLLRLSPLIGCLMLRIFTKFPNMCFHRTAGNSKLTNQMLVWQLPSALSFAMFHLWIKIAHNNRCFQIVKWFWTPPHFQNFSFYSKTTCFA